MIDNNQIDLISRACGEEPRDFTNEEKQFISQNLSFRNDLIFWLESRTSDGCWTENNISFLRDW